MPPAQVGGISRPEIVSMEAGAVHPLTGPVFVKSAQPGDLLEVEFLDIVPQPHAFTAIVPGFTVPLGKAVVRREGRDVTVVAYIGMLYCAMEAAEELDKGGISVEIVDPRTLRPMDGKTIVGSVRKRPYVASVMRTGAEPIAARRFSIATSTLSTSAL